MLIGALSINIVWAK